jgi:hypothetical protein
VIAPPGDAFWIRDEGLALRVPAECRVIRTRTMSGQWWLARSRGGRAPQSRSSRGFGLARRAASALLVPDTYAGWRPFAVRAALEVLKEERVDALYSTSPPESTHLAAAAVHRRTGIPWVADFRDPWMNLHLLPTPTSLHRRAHRTLERRVCARASAVVVTTPWHRDRLAAAYPGMAPVELIRNGYDPDDIESVADIAPRGDSFQIVHAGMLTQKRSAVSFLRGLKLFLDRTPGARERCRAIFLGPRESENDEAASALGLSDVASFRDTAPHAETLKIERSSHILVLIKHANPLYDGLVPGKLYEYIGVGRPILAVAPEGEAAAIVRRHRRGEVVAHDDPAKIAGALAAMYAAYRAGTLDASYDLSPVADYRRDVLAGRLAERLDALGGLRGPQEKVKA